MCCTTARCPTSGRRWLRRGACCGRAVHTRRRYTSTAALALIASGGLIVERCSYINSLLFPLPLAQRLLERALPMLEQGQSDLALPAPPVNELLRWPLAGEAAWLARGGTFPIGLSILIRARRAS
jgi:hypothetical protein